VKIGQALDNMGETGWFPGSVLSSTKVQATHIFGLRLDAPVALLPLIQVVKRKIPASTERGLNYNMRPHSYLGPSTMNTTHRRNYKQEHTYVIYKTGRKFEATKKKRNKG
jgi:hypothetical protein